MTTLRLTRIALAVSVAVNVLLIAGIWLYIHFAGMLAIIEDTVGIFG